MIESDIMRISFVYGDFFLLKTKDQSDRIGILLIPRVSFQKKRNKMRIDMRKREFDQIDFDIE